MNNSFKKKTALLLAVVMMLVSVFGAFPAYADTDEYVNDEIPEKSFEEMTPEEKTDYVLSLSEDEYQEGEAIVVMKNEVKPLLSMPLMAGMASPNNAVSQASPNDAEELASPNDAGESAPTDGGLQVMLSPDGIPVDGWVEDDITPQAASDEVQTGMSIGDLLDNAETIHTGSEAAYREALGEDAIDIEEDKAPLFKAFSLFSSKAEEEPDNEENESGAVTIAFISNKNLSTPDLLTGLFADERVLWAEPNYIRDYDFVVPEEEKFIPSDEEPVYFEPSPDSGKTGEDVKPDSTGTGLNAFIPDEDIDLRNFQWGMAHNGDDEKLFSMRVDEVDEGSDIGLDSWDKYQSAPGPGDSKEPILNSSGTICIMDSGVDDTNPDLEDVMIKIPDEVRDMTSENDGIHGWNSADDDPDCSDVVGHGTHCAGIAAAEWDEMGISGVAKGAKLLSVRICNSNGSITDKGIISGYQYLLDLDKAYKACDEELNLRSVNCSFGGGSISPVVKMMVIAIGDIGAVTVFASGNSASNNDYNQSSAYAGYSPCTLCVDSSNISGLMSEYSNYGYTTDILAPGEQIMSTWWTDENGQNLVGSGYFPEANTQNSYFDTFKDAGYYPALAGKKMSEITVEKYSELTEYPKTLVTQATASFDNAKIIGGIVSDYGYDRDSGCLHVSKEEMTREVLSDGTISYSVVLMLPTGVLAAPDTSHLGMAVSGKTEKGWISKKNIRILPLVEVEDDAETKIAWSPLAPANAGLHSDIPLIELAEALDSYYEQQGVTFAGFHTVYINGNAYSPVKLEFKIGTKERESLYVCIDNIGMISQDEFPSQNFGFLSGTSMAAPCVSGCVAVAFDQYKSELEALETPKEKAAYVVTKLKSLAQESRNDSAHYEELCSSGGQIYMGGTVEPEPEKRTPVINSAVAAADYMGVTVRGICFGDTKGNLLIDEEEFEITGWSDTEIRAKTSEAITPGVKKITVETAYGRTATSLFVLNSTALFEKEIKLPEDLKEFNSGVAQNQIRVCGDELMLLDRGSDGDELWVYSLSNDSWDSINTPGYSPLALFAYEGHFTVLARNSEALGFLIFDNGEYSYCEITDGGEPFSPPEPEEGQYPCEVIGDKILLFAKFKTPHGERNYVFVISRKSDDEFEMEKYILNEEYDDWPTSPEITSSGSRIYLGFDKTGFSSERLLEIGYEDDALVVEDFSHRLPGDDLEDDSVIWNGGIAASETSLYISGLNGTVTSYSGLTDTYICDLTSEGDAVEYCRRASIGNPLVAYSAYDSGWLYTLVTSYYEPDYFALRATKLSYIVSLDPGNGQDVRKYTVAAGDSFREPEEPVRPGYMFEGWFTPEGEKYSFGEPVMEDVSLTARWTKKTFSVTFIYRNGSENIRKTVGYNEKVTKPDTPVWNGYTFDVWCRDDNCEEAYDFNTPVTEDLFLYARWKKNPETKGRIRTEDKPVEIGDMSGKSPQEIALAEEIKNNTGNSAASAASLAAALKDKIKKDVAKNGKDILLFIDMKLTDVVVDERETAALTYDVTPKKSDIDAGGHVGEPEKVKNSDIVGTVKLRLPIPKSINEKYVTVIHESEGYPVKTYRNLTIVNQGTDKAYVEIKITHFSTFELSFTDQYYFDPVPVRGSSSSVKKLFTGTPGNPVTNGTWSYDAAADTWSYKTTEKFTDTWGYIANPYAGGEAAWFYFDKNGNMLTGWHWIYWKGSKKCFYFNPAKDRRRGACQLGGITPDGYTVNEYGAWTVNGVVQER